MDATSEYTVSGSSPRLLPDGVYIIEPPIVIAFARGPMAGEWELAAGNNWRHRESGRLATCAEMQDAIGVPIHEEPQTDTETT